MSVTRFYAEIDCPDCGRHFWSSGLTKDHSNNTQKCFGPGPSRRLIEIDYQAAAKATADLLSRMGALYTPANLKAETTGIIDAALGSVNPQ